MRKPKQVLKENNKMEQTKKNTIMVYSTMKKSRDGKQFRAYWTKMKIVVAGEEEKGKQLKNVNVSFRKSVNTYNIKRGLITGEIDAPFKYEIVTDGNGNKKYPCVWVRSVDSYQEKIAHHEQSDFVTEEDGEETEL